VWIEDGLEIDGKVKQTRPPRQMSHFIHPSIFKTKARCVGRTHRRTKRKIQTARRFADIQKKRPAAKLMTEQAVEFTNSLLLVD